LSHLRVCRKSIPVDVGSQQAPTDFNGTDAEHDERKPQLMDHLDFLQGNNPTVRAKSLATVATVNIKIV